MVDDLEPARRFVSSMLRAHKEFQVVGVVSALFDIWVLGCKASQFGLRNGKFRKATIQADHSSLGKDDHGPFVYTFSSRKMYVHLHTKFFLLVGGASLTGHSGHLQIRRPTLYCSRNAYQGEVM